MSFTRFHDDPQRIKKYLQELDKIPDEERIDQRIENFNKMGVWK